VPKIELLWWDGCPSTPKALADLRAAVAEQGGDPDAVVMREVATDDDARREAFIGSPTVRVDGDDLFPPVDDEPAGLTCRIYRLTDGRISPTPDPTLLREALSRRLNP
jgi:hypothetical protein